MQVYAKYTMPVTFWWTEQIYMQMYWKIDENNHVIIRSSPYEKGVLISQSTFLHKTKITSTSINEKKALEKKRDKKHPKGRSISIMEMTQVMLNHPQIHSDLLYENISTLPLEQRSGIQKSRSNENAMEIYDDGTNLSNLSQKIREEKLFPE